MTSQLERDIYKRIEEKFKLWLDDSMALSDMAGLERRETLGHISGVCLTCFAAMALVHNASEERLLQVVCKAYRHAKETRDEILQPVMQQK